MILQNGKRIDGCSDTVPVGTLQPFLGLVPPKGYLACQGQMVSKITYSELYEICGDTFGASTETHFYLPDLRGKTLAGYDKDNAAMNTIGKLIGQAEHTHSIPNHSHTYSLRYSSYWDAFVQFADDQGADTLLAARQKDGSYKKAFAYTPTKMDTHMNLGVEANRTDVSTTAHFQVDGDTSEVNTTASTTSNYQPTITVNWIVKAVMLIPDYIIVEDTLNSDSAVDALSARQGKILNEKFADYATKSEMIQYLPLTGGTLTGPLKFSSSGVETFDSAGIQIDIYGNFTHKRENDADTWGITNYTGDKTLRYTFGTGKLEVPGDLYVKGKQVARYTAGNVVYNETYAGGAFFRVHNNGGNMLMIGGGLQIIAETPSRTPFITIEGITSSYSSFQYSIIAGGSNKPCYRFRAYNKDGNIVIDNEDCALPVGWYNVTGFIYLKD